MKCIFKIADDYISKSDWKDLALIKFCLCSMGILLGLAAPRRWRKLISVCAMLVFIASYVPLMLKFFGIAAGVEVEQAIEIE